MNGKAIPWQENKVISVETRKGVYVIAQMLKSSYIRFYNAFREDQRCGRPDLRDVETLFVRAVAKQFFQLSNVQAVKGAITDTEREVPRYWIKVREGSRTVKVWAGTDDEREFIEIGGRQEGVWLRSTYGNPE